MDPIGPNFQRHINMVVDDEGEIKIILKTHNLLRPFSDFYFPFSVFRSPFSVLRFFPQLYQSASSHKKSMRQFRRRQLRPKHIIGNSIESLNFLMHDGLMLPVKKLVKGVLAALFLAFSAKAHALNDVYVIHFVLDGARYDILNEAVQKGELPFIQKTFFENGTVFENALTAFPTVSTPGYIAFATGLSTGNSGIFFLEWFDRTKRKVVGYLTLKSYNRVNTDLINRMALLDPNVKTLYPPTTLFEKLKPHPTAAVYTHFRQGASIATPP